MIEIIKHGNEYRVINTATRRILGRSTSQRVALDMREQVIRHHEQRSEQLRRNEATRAASLGA